MVKKCTQCKKSFEKASTSSRAYFAMQKFCGQECFAESRRDVTIPAFSEEHKRKIGLSNKDNKSGSENGKHTRFKEVEIKAYDTVGGVNEYRNLHKWVAKQLGKPEMCSECGKVGSGRQMHWANISKEYKKDINDWKRLCVKCHYEFDSNRKVLPVGEYIY